MSYWYGAWKKSISERGHNELKQLSLSLIITLLMCWTPIGWTADNLVSTLDGIVEPSPAPAWDIAQWINGDPGNVDNNADKVIVIDFFQMWCPGCNSFTGPLMQSWQDRFSEEIASGDLILVKIHTVFEGHGHQSVHRLKKYLIDKGVTMPVGVDRHLDGDYLPETKKRYKTSGTPELVMIDRDGMIRFQQFGFFDPADAELYLESLIGSTGSSKREKPVVVCLSSELCG